MNKLCVLVIGLLMCGGISAQGIEFFDGSWKETLAKAQEEEKLIFVDAYTTWCGPCKRMAKNVFTKEEVGKVFNEKFINAKIDMEGVKHIDFISKYRVTAYPTLFFINGEGKIIIQKVGGQQVEGLLLLAKEAEKKDDRSVNFVEAYEQGKRDHDFIIDYIKALNKVGKSSLKVSNDYLKRNPKLAEDKMSEFLLNAVTEADSKLFDKMMDRKKQMISMFGKERIQSLVKSATDKTVTKSIEFEIIDLANEASEKYAKFHSKQESEDYSFNTRLKYFAGTGQQEEYINESQKYFKKCIKKDNEKLGNLVNGIAAYKSNAKAKTLLLDVSKQMVKNESTWRNLLTYSNALLLNDNPSKALEMAKKALDYTEDAREKRAIQSVIDKAALKV